jgi:hypothetical protein
LTLAAFSTLCQAQTWQVMSLVELALWLFLPIVKVAPMHNN